MSIRYLCDPSRNDACSKALCFTRGGPCGLTDDPRFAVRDLLGRVVIAEDPNANQQENEHERENL